MSQNGGKRGNSVFLTLASSSPPSPLTSVPGFILSTFFSPLSRSSPQRRPRTPPPPSLTPLSHVFSTLSACVDDPSKCIVCPFMFCIFYSPAELLSCFFKIDLKIVLRRSHFIRLQKGCKHILLKLSLSPKTLFPLSFEVFAVGERPPLLCI